MESIGELLTYDAILKPASGSTGPDDVVLGQDDMVRWYGNCMDGGDQATAYTLQFYENASP